MGSLPPPTIDLDDLGFDQGGYLLVDRALRGVEPGTGVIVQGTDPHLDLHLGTWCRAEGHVVDSRLVVRGEASTKRWAGAIRAGNPREPQRRALPSWGLAARGALVESGGTELRSADLVERDFVWSDLAPKLYRQAAAGQWDPERAIDWELQFDLPNVAEDAVVQVMTYLIENEQAALAVCARHLPRIHPHFREVTSFLATQIADEARHVEVFTRRALLRRNRLGTSTAGGRASLQTLVDESDFALGLFLLSVLGEGTFLDLLSFLERCAPDPVTRRIAHLVRQDEARHVAFGQALLEHRVALDPTVIGQLRIAIKRRHATLRQSAGLNQDVHDALVILAAGELTSRGVRSGWEQVQELMQGMYEGRRRRLVRLGFDADEAGRLSELHTQNFM